MDSLDGSKGKTHSLERFAVVFFGILSLPFDILFAPFQLCWRLCGPFLSRAAGGLRRLVWIGYLALRIAARKGYGLLRTALTRIPLPLLLGTGCGLLGLISIYFSLFGRDFLIQAGGFTEPQLKLLTDGGHMGSLDHLALLGGLFGLLQLLTAVLVLLGHPFRWMRNRACLGLLKASGAGFLVIWICLLILVIRGPSYLYLTDDKIFDKVFRNELWCAGTWLWIPGLLADLFFLFAILRRSVTEFYGGKVFGKRWLAGDRFYQELESHGKDPRFRTSLYLSSFGHVFCLFLVPLLLSRAGCDMEPYGIPKGSGQQVVTVVKVVKKQRQKKKYIFNMNSAISFYVPTLEDSDVMKEVDQVTENQYEAMQVVDGKLGAGGGRGGGWPDGMENAKLRFIRLEYNGGDWNQDMGQGADYNMLKFIRQSYGFRIWPNTESIPISALTRFPKHYAPPFVYLTGGKFNGAISLTTREIRTLRWYCLEEGGMIFADNGGGWFNSSFRLVMAKVFPEKKWIDIADDDIIYQAPYAFPNGAPPLWHHSGNRAVGIKDKGRWVVFYHQGDINDAWKDGGSGAPEDVRQAAFRMGVNVIAYSFNQYLALHGSSSLREHKE